MSIISCQPGTSPVVSTSMNASSHSPGAAASEGGSGRRISADRTYGGGGTCALAHEVPRVSRVTARVIGLIQRSAPKEAIPVQPLRADRDAFARLGQRVLADIE